MQSVTLDLAETRLEGELAVPDEATGLVLFAHGSGSSRHSPRNRFVADQLNRGGLGTLLLDLLTPQEDAEDRHTRRWRFDIALLGHRVVGAVDWSRRHGLLKELPIGTFGASTGAAAALIAAAERPRDVQAVVSRGGRPDLAGDALEQVCAPTLLIVGGHDPSVIDLNEQAMTRMKADVRLAIVEGATHLFEEPGTLEEVAWLARQFFAQHLLPPETEAEAERAPAGP